MAKKSSILPNLFRDSIPLTGKDSGVYGIINRLDGRIYIGSSGNLSRRVGTHKYDFRNNIHAVRLLRKEVVENPENFEFVIIEQIPSKDKKELLAREQFWMDFYRSYIPEMGYNRTRYSHSVLGLKHTDMLPSFACKNKGKRRPPRSAEWSEKISKGLAGRRNPRFHKAVIQMDMDGNEIKRFDCITDAAKAIGDEGRNAGIVLSLKNPEKRTTAYGFKWRYA